MKLPAKFENILCSRIRATSTKSQIKVALNSLHRKFFKLFRKFYLDLLITFQQYRKGVTQFVFEI